MDIYIIYVYGFRGQNGTDLRRNCTGKFLYYYYHFMFDESNACFLYSLNAMHIVFSNKKFNFLGLLAELENSMEHIATPKVKTKYIFI